jgi:hypothetical protein
MFGQKNKQATVLRHSEQMVEESMSQRNSVPILFNMESAGKQLLHTHLSIMELQSELIELLLNQPEVCYTMLI